MDYGMRPDKTAKGAGYFGEIKRPDGKVMTEITVGVGIDGKETNIPLIVPTLDKAELNYLMRNNPKSKMFMEKMPPSIMDKAVEHAVMRMKEGKSPYASPEEITQLPTK